MQDRVKVGTILAVQFFEQHVSINSTYADVIRYKPLRQVDVSVRRDHHGRVKSILFLENVAQFQHPVRARTGAVAIGSSPRI